MRAIKIFCVVIILSEIALCSLTLPWNNTIYAQILKFLTTIVPTIIALALTGGITRSLADEEGGMYD